MKIFQVLFMWSVKNNTLGCPGGPPRITNIHLSLVMLRSGSLST